MGFKPIILSAFQIFIWCSVSRSFGQEEARSKRIAHQIDFSLRIGKGQLGAQGAYWARFGLGKAEKFSISPGIRISNHWIRNADFTTAPAHLASKNDLVDTLLIEKGHLVSINLAIDFRYQLAQKWALGFNIDFAGITLGNEVSSKINSTFGTFFPLAKPTSGNLLLVDNRDIGTLYSEFYLQYQLLQKVSLKSGLCHVFTEYSTDQNYIPGINNYRYRFKHNGLMVGLVYLMQ